MCDFDLKKYLESLRNDKEHKKVIILNKTFVDGYSKTKGHIGHEIIDFIRTDDENGDGHLFIYNNPYGQIDAKYVVTYSEDENKYEFSEDDTKYPISFMLLTTGGEGSSKEFFIKYVILLKKKFSTLSHTNNADEMNRKINRLHQRLENNNLSVKYGNKDYFEMCQESIDNVFPITFEGFKVFKPEADIKIDLGDKYKYYRNKGYIHYFGNTPSSDDETNQNELYDYIVEEMFNSDLKEYITSPITESDKDNNYFKDTYLDFTGQSLNESAYSNILFNVLNNENMVNEFVKCIYKKDISGYNIKFKVTKEQVVDSKNQHRMDIAIVGTTSDSRKIKIVIENKVMSGINTTISSLEGKKIVQLDEYLSWAKSNSDYHACILIFPDYREEEIKRNIDELCVTNAKEIKKEYEFVGYSNIAEFLKNLIKKYKDTNIPNFWYLEDAYIAFYKLGYKQLEEYYRHLFANKLFIK